MSSSITSQLMGMQNSTAQMQAAEAKKNGPTKELGQDAFMQLMLEQLKNQDPMNPMDNQQFLQQQAQMTQLNEIQKMNSNMSLNNEIMQASSLIGKDVTITDPNDNKKQIKGTVASANFGGASPTISVNGKDYPIGYVVTVGNPGTTANNSTSNNSNNSNNNTANNSTT